jgi:hypothetical protein
MDVDRCRRIVRRTGSLFRSVEKVRTPMEGDPAGVAGGLIALAS